MVKGLYTAWTGMLDEQNRLDILTNNLANADTTGYKKEGTTHHTFADTLAIKIKDTSDYGQPRVLGNISMGVHIGEVYTDFSQGSFKVPDYLSEYPDGSVRLTFRSMRYIILLPSTVLPKS